MRRLGGARFAALDVELLAARARAGDRAAARALRTRITPLARQLAFALVGEAWVVPGVVRGALDEAMKDTTGAYAVAVVTAVQRRAVAARAGRRGATARTPEERLAQAVGVLCDGQGHSHRSAAALLGLTAGEVAALHGQGRVALGVDASASRCRGWHLVSGEGLTAPEQTAADGHLALCRPCRDALAARAAARSRLTLALPLGGTALGGIAAAVAGLSQVGASAGGAAALAGATAAVTAAGVVAAPYVAPPVRPAAVAPAAQPAAPVTAPDAAVTAPGPVSRSPRRPTQALGVRPPGSVGSPGPADAGLPVAGQRLPGRPDGPAGPEMPELSDLELPPAGLPLPVLTLPGLPTPGGPLPALPQTGLPVERDPATGGLGLGTGTSGDAATGVAPPDGDGDRDGGKGSSKDKDKGKDNGKDNGKDDGKSSGGDDDESDGSADGTVPPVGRDGAGTALVPTEVPPVVATVPRAGPLPGRPTATASPAPPARVTQPSGRPRPRPTPSASAQARRPATTTSPAPLVVRLPAPSVSTTRGPAPAPPPCAFPSPVAATPRTALGLSLPPSVVLPTSPSGGVPSTPTSSPAPAGTTTGGLADTSVKVTKDQQAADPALERSATLC